MQVAFMPTSFKVELDMTQECLSDISVLVINVYEVINKMFNLIEVREKLGFKKSMKIYLKAALISSVMKNVLENLQGEWVR